MFIGNTSLHFKSAVVRRVLKVFDSISFGRYVILLPTPQGLHRKLTKSWLLNKKIHSKSSLVGLSWRPLHLREDSCVYREYSVAFQKYSNHPLSASNSNEHRHIPFIWSGAQTRCRPGPNTICSAADLSYTLRTCIRRLRAICNRKKLKPSHFNTRALLWTPEKKRK